MVSVDDIELVRQYAESGSEEAFAALVSRHINLVYSVALRHVGNRHHAQEITQAVFLILAKKAPGLKPGTLLSGWLFQTTRWTSANYLRGEIRRTKREEEAFMQSLTTGSGAEPWMQVSPLLDQAIANLSPADRDSIIMRFFEAKDFRELAAAMGTSESAARMRVSRAVEKLRSYFIRKRILVSVGAFTTLLASNYLQAAPTGLASKITEAVVGGAAATGSMVTLVKTTLKIMAWTKAKTALLTTVGVALLIGTGTVAIREVAAHRVYPWQVANVNTRILNQVAPQVRIVPTRFAQGGWDHKATKFWE